MSGHSPVEVRRQVWHSLVSMLQVYAHAASLNGKPYAVTSADCSAVVRYEEASLTVSFVPDTGVATWRLIRSGREDHGHFEIDQHGAVNFPEGPKELDTLAIDWMDHLARPEQVSQREHAKL